jgi:scyllo-inosose 3-dehydrogenase
MRAVQLSADWSPREGYDVSEVETERGHAKQACSVWRNPVFDMATLPVPDPGPGEVLLKIGQCGVCGSDSHCMETDHNGYLIFSGPARLPVVPGHEYSGTVVAVGKGVSTVRIGEIVTAEGMLYCGRCETCRRGAVNQCPHLQMTGFTENGAYAEYICVNERYLWSLDGVAEQLGSAAAALELGALVEPISCSYNGIWVVGGGMCPGSHVAVFGCGPIGLGAIALTVAAGAASVTAFDRIPERLAIARQLGAAAYHLDELPDGPAALLRAKTGGAGVDLQVEAAGAAKQTVPEMERAMAAGGLIVYLGRTGGQAPVGLDYLVSGAGRIVGARGHAGGGCYPNVIRMLEAGVIDPRAMITARVSLDGAIAAIQRSTLRTDGKILVSPG